VRTTRGTFLASLFTDFTWSRSEEEFEKNSANQTPWQPSWIFNRLKSTSRGKIMIGLVARHAVVLKEKLKMWKVYDIRTDRQTYEQTDARHFSIRLVQRWTKNDSNILCSCYQTVSDGQQLHKYKHLKSLNNKNNHNICFYFFYENCFPSVCKVTCSLGCRKTVLSWWRFISLLISILLTF